MSENINMQTYLVGFETGINTCDYVAAHDT